MDAEWKNQCFNRSSYLEKLLLILVITSLVLAIWIAAAYFRVPHEAEHSAAVVSNGAECSALASEILKKGGSAADAAIVALLCEGITCPESTGLGGGFVMTIFTKRTNSAETLIAREVAPFKATKDMFVNVTTITGGKSIAVPGALKGYWELHAKYGRLKWSHLFDGVIRLCRDGHIVSAYLSRKLQQERDAILASPELSNIFVNPATSDLYKEGEYIRRIKLAETLEIIQKEGADSMYRNGTVARLLVKDIKKADGLVTIEDLMNYTVRWEDTVSMKLRNNRTLHTVSLPASGGIVTFILNVLNGYKLTAKSSTSMHRIVETLKYAYAKRTFLGDGRFVTDAIDMVKNLTDVNFATEIRKIIDDNRTYNDYRHYGVNVSDSDDHGTAHLNVLAPNGDAIAVTGTINQLFGSKIVSSQTGIILNDEMDDFSTPGKNNSFGLPPSPANFIHPRKMPLSSMCPTIMLDQDNNVELLIGAAGGSKITSSVSYILAQYLFFNNSIRDAVRAPRIHHQLLPMQLFYEDGISDNIIEDLKQIGHKLHRMSSDGFSSVTAIGKNGKQLVPVYDPRRSGSAIIIEKNMLCPRETLLWLDI